ncbi:MAG: Fic family protein [Methanomassiliicoccales archaeon]|nr:Fic family protein [Methanomassiliicoccales archaeon]
MIKELQHLYQYQSRGYPVRHRRKVPFKPEMRVTDDFISMENKIREYDSELDRFILSSNDYRELIIDAYSSNVHKTTSLEGNPLSENEVKRITRRTFDGSNSLENEVGPAKEIVNHLKFPAILSFFRFPWTHEKIKTMHSMLLEGISRQSTLSSYRETRANIVTDDHGQELFIPCPPEHIEAEMNSLLEWVNNEASAYNPIVGATVFFHEFESIHPFQDGNGRVGRSLFNIFLRNLGYKNLHKCKIENFILGDPELYYQLLAFTDDSGSYRELIDMFTISILKCYEQTIDEYRKKDLLGRDLDENSKRLLLLAKKNGAAFTIKEANNWVDGIGYQSVRYKLNELVELGGLRKIGKGRGLKLVFNDPMISILGSEESSRDTKKV